MIALVACGPAAPAPVTSPGRGPVPAPAAVPANQPSGTRAPLDVLATLATETAFTLMRPASLRLELDHGVIEAPLDRAPPVEVVVLERIGRAVRVGIRLSHVRFAAWTEPRALFSPVLRDTVLDVGSSRTNVTLRAGALVEQVLETDRDRGRRGQTRVELHGAFEAQGWIASAALGTTTAARVSPFRIPRGGATTILPPGTIVRTEPRWASVAVATATSVIHADVVHALPDGWFEISYRDGSSLITGFTSIRLPRAPTRNVRHDPDLLPPIVPNATGLDRTCLYAEVDGLPIGALVGAQPIQLEAIRTGWARASVDTPWGAIAFVVRLRDGVPLICASDAP